jgi:hypothetical protein
MGYSVGDILTYECYGVVRIVRVMMKESCIKLDERNRGAPGFSGIVKHGPEAGKHVWGYDRQIIHVGE